MDLGLPLPIENKIENKQYYIFFFNKTLPLSTMAGIKH
jgi:hypothetical protein